jgi:hypothetical protein
MWISGDVAVSTATEQVIAACRRARIPVFTVMPPSVKSGALFDLGANFFEIGRHIGDIAADVLGLVLPDDPAWGYVRTQKLSEYLASGRPVLAIVPPGEVAAELAALDAGVAVGAR